MELPTPKELLSIARACRKAGITRFRSGDIEFTLSDAPPVSQYRRDSRNSSKNVAISPAGSEADTKFESDGLTEEQLMFYSVQGQPEEVASE